MKLLAFFALSIEQWVWIVLVAIIVGFSKTGIRGITMVVIPIVASIFGGKASTGIMLPMLIIGDIFAVKYYNRHADWGNIRKLLPWTLVGVVLGAIIGGYINDQQFKLLIAVSVFVCLFILIYSEKKGDALRVPNAAWFYALIGIASGFTSMIGNAAGPIMSIYLLARGFKKNSYMGTVAWFFLILNLTKMPFQIFVWHNISLETILLATIMIPGILIGAILGIYVVKKINEKPFRYTVILMTAFTAFKLIFI